MANHSYTDKDKIKDNHSVFDSYCTILKDKLKYFKDGYYSNQQK